MGGSPHSGQNCLNFLSGSRGHWSDESGCGYRCAWGAVFGVAAVPGQKFEFQDVPHTCFTIWTTTLDASSRLQIARALGLPMMCSSFPTTSASQAPATQLGSIVQIMYQATLAATRSQNSTTLPRDPGKRAVLPVRTTRFHRYGLGPESATNRKDARATASICSYSKVTRFDFDHQGGKL